MLVLIFKRLASMVLIMAVVSLLLFTIFDSPNMRTSAARNVLGPYAQAEQLEIWLEQNGYNRPFTTRYFEWAGNVLTGDFGQSTVYKQPVGPLLLDRLANTGLLAGLMFLFMIPLALTLGVLSGMREGSLLDRSISTLSIVTTSIPEMASAAFLSGIFVFTLGWLPGTATMGNGFWVDWPQIVLPVAVLVLYDFGYVARMTRASMAEVMTSQYIRTAVLKGIPFREVIMKHALRNALIAPFTVIVLQLNWLLSGVIVVEVFFAYRGFGKFLIEGALNNDVNVVQACTIVAVIVAVLSQIISDIGYTYLNPRIRFS